jgi:hypothetical protein
VHVRFYINAATPFHHTCIYIDAKHRNIYIYIPLLPDQTCYWKKIIFFPSVRLMFHPYTTLKLLEIPRMVVIFLVPFLCV